jgi:hypothetical protein
MSTQSAEIYDLAVSFAGEQRTYVEQVVRACQRRGLRVFYDRDMNNEWWGKSFIREQRKVYSSRTRFFVPFLSSEYLAKPIQGLVQSPFWQVTPGVDGARMARLCQCS